MRGWRRVTVALGLLGAAGCTSPDPNVYTLAPLPGQAQPGGPPTLEVRRPGLAGYLDRSEIVRRGDAYRLNIASGDQWGEPLGDMIGRILAEDLTERLPGSTVFSNQAVSSTQATVSVDVERFDSDRNGNVMLLAQVAVQRGPDQPAAARTVRLTGEARSPSTSDMVAAMSQLLGELADSIAAMLRTG